jgi:cAMP-dependent protein kinase regulator
MANKNKGPRSSVSSEAFGAWNKKADFVPEVIPKSEDSKERLGKRLGQAFMFSALDEKEKSIVIDAMAECKFKKGDKIIKQGDDGEVLYVVDSGTLSCYKLFVSDAC